MVMEKASEDQMGCCCCMRFLRNPPPWVSLLPVPLLIFAGYWGFGFLCILLTSSALILSTLLLTSSKSKPQLVNHLETSATMDYVVSKPKPESEATTQKKEAQESTITNKQLQVHDFLPRSPSSSSSSSESASLYQSSTSDDSEGNADHSTDEWADDEESLIEIALPSGHYVGDIQKQEEPKLMNVEQRKLQDLLELESIFQKHSLMELLAEINEMNEEDNMIEIDLTMGSIKCSRFEIEAA